MIENVANWLKKQGFLLEMETADAFRQAGFDVRQSTHYIDHETGKAREIDVLARDPDVLGIIDISFVLECKTSKKPWVLLCSGDTLSGYNRLFAFAPMSSECRRSFAERLPDLVDVVPWLKKESFAGFSFRQAHSEPAGDPAYGAAMAVASAVTEVVRDSRGEYRPPFRIAFPVIVVDAPLLECSLDESGSIRVTEISEGEFLFTGALSTDFGSCIRVVAAERIAAFASEAKQVADQIRHELHEEEARVRDSWTQRRGL